MSDRDLHPPSFMRVGPAVFLTDAGIDRAIKALDFDLRGPEAVHLLARVETYMALRACGVRAWASPSVWVVMAAFYSPRSLRRCYENYRGLRLAVLGAAV